MGPTRKGRDYGKGPPACQGKSPHDGHVTPVGDGFDMAARRSNLARGLMLLGLLAAGGVAFWLLHGPPAADEKGGPLTRATAPDVRPPELPEPTARDHHVTPPTPEPARTGAAKGRIVSE